VQQIARVVQASRNVFVGQAGIIRENVGFIPTIGHQADDEFNGQPRAANDRLSGQDGRVEYDMIVRRRHSLSYQTAMLAPILLCRGSLLAKHAVSSNLELPAKAA
jgi:hypothetical protein